MGNYLQNIFSNVQITDILDILLVTFLVFELLNFIQETRAWQVAKGILLFVFATLASQWLHLYTLHWILSGLTTIGAIALVIIFQPELRRLLENIGGNRFRNFVTGVDRSEAKKMAKEIGDALEYLSRTKTGALIVIERDTSLHDYTEVGTIIDAKITSELIGNIFYEGAPLHDGALIIRRDKLYAGGCVLPLTQNKSLPKELGTRHRAGIGITENSDCYSIIVSEETGIISVAEAGRIRRGMTPEKVELALLNMYLAKEETKSKIKKPFGKSKERRKANEG